MVGRSTKNIDAFTRHYACGTYADVAPCAALLTSTPCSSIHQFNDAAIRKNPPRNDGRWDSRRSMGSSPSQNRVEGDEKSTRITSCGKGHMAALYRKTKAPATMTGAFRRADR